MLFLSTETKGAFHCAQDVILEALLPLVSACGTGGNEEGDQVLLARGGLPCTGRVAPRRQAPRALGGIGVGDRLGQPGVEIESMHAQRLAPQRALIQCRGVYPVAWPRAVVEALKLEVVVEKRRN